MNIKNIFNTASRVSQLLKLSQCIPLGMTQRQRSEDGLCSFRVQ